MAWEWLGGNGNTTFSHFPLKARKWAYTVGRKIGIGEKWYNLDICILNLIFSCFYAKRLPFLASLQVICFMMSMKTATGAMR